MVAWAVSQAVDHPHDERPAAHRARDRVLLVVHVAPGLCPQQMDETAAMEAVAARRREAYVGCVAHARPAVVEGGRTAACGRFGCERVEADGAAWRGH